jgi:hypothetical protein
MIKPEKPDGDMLIREYILQGCKDAKKAAIKAGYSPKSAEQSASRVLRSDKAKKAIEKYRATELKSYVWSKEDKLNKLEAIIEKAMSEDPDKGMINMASAIAAMKEHNLMQGDNAPTETNNVHTIKSFSEMYGQS